MEKERNRNFILYEFKCVHSAFSGSSHKKYTYICRIESAGTVKESTCRRWFAKFLNGEEGLKDKKESFGTKESIFYRCGIELLGQRYLEVIDNNGEYLLVV
jgi:hypothetical protein